MYEHILYRKGTATTKRSEKGTLLNNWATYRKVENVDLGKQSLIWRRKENFTKTVIRKVARYNHKRLKRH